MQNAHALTDIELRCITYRSRIDKQFFFVFNFRAHVAIDRFMAVPERRPFFHL